MEDVDQLMDDAALIAITDMIVNEVDLNDDVGDRNLPRQPDDVNVRVIGFVATDRADFSAAVPLVNHLINKDVFSSLAYQNKDYDAFSNRKFDRERGHLYMMLPLSFTDLETAAAQAEVDVDKSEAAFAGWSAMHREQTMRNLLFMFTCCHEVVIVEPSSRFDMRWISVLRALESMRPTVIEAVKSMNGPIPDKKWLHPGTCTPTLSIFVKYPLFLERRLMASWDKPNVSAITAQHQKIIDRLQHSLNAQVKRILRSARLASMENQRNASKASKKLFSIDLKKEMVFVGTIGGGRKFGDVGRDPGQVLLDIDSQIQDATFSNLSRLPSKFDGVVRLHDIRHPNISLTQFSKSKLKIYPDHECVSLTEWIEVASKINGELVKTPQNKDTVAMIDLGLIKDPLHEFSMKRCKKELPYAASVYESLVPQYYREGDHRAALAQAVQKFKNAACGPALASYVTLLERDCTERWESGKQLCEKVSLMGFKCKLPLKTANRRARSGGDDEVENRHKCCSGISFKCSCVCGNTQKGVEDPFVFSQASMFHFEAPCCSRIDQTTQCFVKFQRSVETFAETINFDDNSKDEAGRDFLNDESLAQLLGQPGPESTEEISNISSGGSSQSAGSVPIWTVAKVGAAREYNPGKGLECVGFVAESNRLLPWNIPAPKKKRGFTKAADSKSSKAKNPWGPMPNTSAKKKDGSKNVWNGQMIPDHLGNAGHLLNSVICYIGCEYECPRGCKFLTSGPNRSVKISKSGVLQDTGTGCLDSDMPIFMPCCKEKCNKNRIIAQLSRLHIVTPDDRVAFSLSPLVKTQKLITDTQRNGGKQQSPADAEDERLAGMSCGKMELDADSYYMVQLPRVFVERQSNAGDCNHGKTLLSGWCKLQSE